jgi:hypothetical protein
MAQSQSDTRIGFIYLYLLNKYQRSSIPHCANSKNECWHIS